MKTPLDEQYATIKKKYPKVLLLFRVKDCYEAINDDAVKISNILNLPLTRSKYKMAGFDDNMLNEYLPIIVKEAGKVAICEPEGGKHPKFKRRS